MDTARTTLRGSSVARAPLAGGGRVSPARLTYDSHPRRRRFSLRHQVLALHGVSRCREPPRGEMRLGLTDMSPVPSLPPSAPLSDLSFAAKPLPPASRLGEVD